MHIGFKTFHILRTVFFVCLLQIITLSTAMAADKIFNVEDVKVDITAKSAVQAREIAFKRAQKKAFATLAERMLDEQDVGRYADQDVDTIASLIQDFEIKDEKLSSVRYIAVYNFRFKDDAVKSFFAGSGVQYTGMASKTALVLPYYQKGATTYLWSPYNVWMKAWMRGNHQSGVVPMVVPLGDLQDVRDIREEDGLSYNDSRLDTMLGRYGAEEAIILMAVPDERLAAVDNPGDAAVGEMKVHIYRTDRGRPEYVQPVTLKVRSTDTLESFMSYAVTRVKRELQRNWKENTSVDPTDTNQIEVNVPIGSLQEWSRVQRSLRNVYGLERMKIVSVKPSMAVVSLVFDGNLERLRTSLASVNLMLERHTMPGQQASDPLSYFSSGRAAVPETYTLRMRQKTPAAREMIYVPGQPQ